jgi:hypothetical protein
MTALVSSAKILPTSITQQGGFKTFLQKVQSDELNVGLEFFAAVPGTNHTLTNIVISWTGYKLTRLIICSCFLGDSEYKLMCILCFSWTHHNVASKILSKGSIASDAKNNSASLALEFVKVGLMAN